MAKPLFFIVWVDGIQHRKETRHEARIFAAFQKLMGKTVKIKPVGFDR